MYGLLGYLMALGLGRGEYAADQVLAQSWKLGLALLAIAAWYMNATAINDLADVAIDQENLPGDNDRPLVTGAAGPKEVKTVAVVGGMAAVVLVLPLGLAAAGLMLVMLGFNVAYSLRPVRLSWRGGLALALLPLGYVGLTMGLGYLAAGTPLSPLLLAFIAMCYLQFLARISLKDYRDVTGDRHHGNAPSSSDMDLMPLSPWR
jgi:4-hydroxybenzoate polyprenyltransferase